MNKIDFFKTELRYIKNARLLDSTKKMIELLPDYFFEIPASSTGKYHPSFALGSAGLVRHTKVAVRFAHELLENECIGNVFNDDEKDMIIISLIMHDGCKSGLTHGQYTVVNHPQIVGKLIRDNKEVLTLEDPELDLICGMIEAHMGPYNKDYKGNTVLPLPSNKYQKFVHMCDLLASKKFLDVHFENDEIVE